MNVDPGVNTPRRSTHTANARWSYPFTKLDVRVTAGDAVSGGGWGAASGLEAWGSQQRIRHRRQIDGFGNRYGDCRRFGYQCRSATVGRGHGPDKCRHVDHVADRRYDRYAVVAQVGNDVAQLQSLRAATRQPDRCVQRLARIRLDLALDEGRDEYDSQTAGEGVYDAMGPDERHEGFQSV
jgi:hypothetical protein